MTYAIIFLFQILFSNASQLDNLEELQEVAKEEEKPSKEKKKNSLEETDDTMIFELCFENGDPIVLTKKEYKERTEKLAKKNYNKSFNELSESEQKNVQYETVSMFLKKNYILRQIQTDKKFNISTSSESYKLLEVEGVKAIEEKYNAIQAQIDESKKTELEQLQDEILIKMYADAYCKTFPQSLIQNEFEKMKKKMELLWNVNFFAVNSYEKANNLVHSLKLFNDCEKVAKDMDLKMAKETRPAVFFQNSFNLSAEKMKKLEREKFMVVKIGETYYVLCYISKIQQAINFDDYKLYISQNLFNGYIEQEMMKIVRKNPNY